jgi:hypothetical protein
VMPDPGFDPTAAQRISEYVSQNAELLTSDPAFVSWLKNEYTPIAGGWQY